MTQQKATLYHYPMACSLASVIAAKEMSVPLEVEHVDVYSKEILTGGSLFEMNPLGQVATLKLSDGSILTQNVAILNWIQTVSRQHPPQRR
jgi:glutathione S-transferase